MQIKLRTPYVGEINKEMPYQPKKRLLIRSETQCIMESAIDEMMEDSCLSREYIDEMGTGISILCLFSCSK